MEWLQFRGGKEVNVKHREQTKFRHLLTMLRLVRVFRTGCEVIKESSFRTN